MKFPIGADGRVALTTVAPGAGDNAQGGLLISSGGSVRSALTAGNYPQNGLEFTNSGMLCIIDATAGLPANSAVQNGLPLDPTGRLCYSTGAIVSYNNGIPFVANGAVAATVV